MFIKTLFFGNCIGDRNCSFHRFLPINSQLECENRHFKTRGGVCFLKCVTLTFVVSMERA